MSPEGVMHPCKQVTLTSMSKLCKEEKVTVMVSISKGIKAGLDFHVFNLIYWSRNLKEWSPRLPEMLTSGIG
jgi:hypothetical protein